MTEKPVGPVGATLQGIREVLNPGRGVRRLAPEDRIDGRTCLITGANSGLGKALAIALARRGGHIVMACRRADEQARAEIMEQGGTRRVDLLRCDLANLDSVARFTDRVRKMSLSLDITVCNAGVVNRAPSRTRYGVSEMFLVNYLSNVLLLTRLLENGSIACNQAQGPTPVGPVPRIVLVSSEAHRWARSVSLETLGRFQPGTLRDVMPAYAEDKFLLTAFGQELARRLLRQGHPCVSVFAFCPGAVRTRIAREAPRWSQPLLGAVFRVFFRSPRIAARPGEYLCCSPAMEGRTGEYLHVMTPREVAPGAADPVFGADLRVRSLELLERLARQAPGDAHE